MTKVPDLSALGSLELAAQLYAYSPANPGSPDRHVTIENLRAVSAEETLLNKTIGAPATTKPVYASLVQLVGAKITHSYRAAGNLTIPAITAGNEDVATFAVVGAAVGDSVTVSPTAGPANNLVMAWAWVSAADTISVKIRNHDVGNYAGGNLAVVALVLRSAAADV